MADDYRTESDSLGEMDVPADAYWGAQTQRAVENFPISGISFSRRFVRALGIVKKAAAQANRDLGLVDDEIAQAIIDAAINPDLDAAQTYVTDRWEVDADEVERGFERIESSVVQTGLDRWR